MENKINKIIPHVPEEKICDKKQEYLERDLGKIYDAMDEKDKKKVTKEFWVKDKMEESNDEEYTNERREENIEELALKDKALKESTLDHVTGLENRKGLYKEIENKIKEVFDVKKNARLSDQEWINIFKKNKDENIVGDDHISLGDISFLSLANDISHELGDGLLKKVADAIKKRGLKAFRHGGDEFTFSFFDMKDSEIKKIISEIKNDLNQNKDFPGLKDYDFSLNMDIGTASLKESLEIFQDLLDDDSVFEEWKNENKEKIRQRKKPRTVLDRFEDVWVAIADKRAFIEKGEERIPLLIDIYKKDKSKGKETYKKLFTFLGKGGYTISEKELLELIDVGEKRQSTEIRKYINKKEKESIAKLSGYNEKRARLIAKKVGVL